MTAGISPAPGQDLDAAPHTLFDKVWNEHVVHAYADGSSLLYIDRHLLHEATSPQAFAGLRAARRKPWRTGSNLAVPDHSVPTQAREAPIRDPVARLQIETLSSNCRSFAIPLYELQDARQGIVHVIGPEQGASLPGMTIVCGDSHTSTHGALAAVAFGIGTSEVEHVLATQTLCAYKPRNMRVRFDGALPKGVTAKDMALALIEHVGTAGATGYAIEYAGSAVQALSVEGRMTLCNLAIEAGARCGLVEFDDITLAYLRDRPWAPHGERWDEAVRHWRLLQSDSGARFDAELVMDACSLAPMVTWGTSPDMAQPVDGHVPDPALVPDLAKRTAMTRALQYMALVPGTPMQEIHPQVIFIGSCTNSRIEDLRAAARMLDGRHIAPSVRRALVVPGSGLVKQQAEHEGLDRIFRAAGFEWRDAGCSMCVGMNDDVLAPGERCASTSNRNFEDRQGVGGRTHLVSPAMAAAAAVAGHFVDIREQA
ncbi:3-isopropylmalate dehydratase large subunit [Ottowia sp. VDI28]|uniref:3-isopropylmalate dehydratase large subunit n=1 Tax=Ottowia sp. VDI28 TaxID=3133968 RepID=UPI003C2AF815